MAYDLFLLFPGFDKIIKKSFSTVKLGHLLLHFTKLSGVFGRD